MCAPFQGKALPQPTQSGSLRRGRPQISLLERRDQRNMESGLAKPPTSSIPTSSTGPSVHPRQTLWQRPQPLMPSRLAQLAPPLQFEEWPNDDETCESDVEWRRPASESVMPHQSDRSMEQYLIDQDHESRVQYISSREHRSLSSPGDRRGRSNTAGRPFLPRQNTDAIVTTHSQYWDEPAFRGNADYQLFVEATFGLSPEHTHHPRSLSRSSSSPVSPPEYGTDRSFGIVDPDECTLGPEDSITYRNFPVPRESFTFDIDSCQPPCFAGSTERNETRQDPGHLRAEDALPNYAQSQAQVVQMARMESVMRAQELQRQWRLAHR